MFSRFRKTISDKPRINIATSCNDNYAKFVFVNLANVDEFLGDTYDVHFYLMQKSIAPKTIRKLQKFSKSLKLTFHNIVVTDDDFLKPLAAVARAGDRERFYDGACHLFLPDDLERILYIDTGDVLFSDTTHEFYFQAFEDKCLAVTAHWSVRAKRTNFSKLPNNTGGFNSGHMLINLDRLRTLDIKPDDYVKFIRKWQKRFPDETNFFLGDQAFLTSFYAGEIFALPHPNPYNIKVADLNGQRPAETPKCIHMNNMLIGIKPWEVPFIEPDDLAAFNVTISTKKKERTIDREFFTDYENEWIIKWWDTCKRTPVYDEIKGASLKNRRLLGRIAVFLRRQRESAMSS